MTGALDSGDPAGGPELLVVELRDLPLALATRSNEHHATLMRELALVDAADDTSTSHGRLLALSSQLQRKYSRLGEAQRDRAQAVAASGGSSVDLRYEVPRELADDVAQLAALLDEVDEFCRAGELVSLVTSPDLVEYRRWVFGEFVSQLRDAAPPTPWRGIDTRELDATSAAARRSASIVIDEDLDLEGSARARELIAVHIEQGVTDLEVDLRGCEFMDSVGISLLLTTMLRLRDSGGSLVVVNAAQPIERTLDHAGIRDLLLRG
jgi:anti-anti-sigma factor